MPRVVIVGGGISGLAVAFELFELGVPSGDVVVLEAKDRPGGNIQTEQTDGFVIEGGPNGFLANSPATFNLVERLGMEDRVLPSRDAAAIRYIYRNGRLHQIPSGPASFLSSPMLSLPGRLRIFGEPFVKKGGHDEESVFDFASRRIGKEAAAVMVDSMVSGVFAGDSKNLELRAAFPRMRELEVRYGSLVKAFLSLRKKRPATGGPAPARPSKIRIPRSRGFGSRLVSFKNGMEEIITYLADRAGDSLRVGSPVASLAGDGGSYRVTLRSGEELQADRVVLACPAPHAAGIVSGVDGELAGVLSTIESASITVVATAFREEDLGGEPLGFGFLVPRTEKVRILGCLWSSSIYDGRAPKGRVLLRTMIGGAHDPEAVTLSDDELLRIVRGELDTTMGFEADPVFHRIYRYREGIPQYTPGHTARRLRILELLEGHRGLFVSGNSYGGVSTNHCIAEAPKIAKSVLES